MKFRVIHEDYWPVPETIQDDLTIDQARELMKTLQLDNPNNEYFICESKDESYMPIEGYDAREDFPHTN
jgi:hypothetical protein